MKWRLRNQTDETLVICSVDTEEDNWEPQRYDLTTRNINELPKLSEMMEELLVPLTYFVTHAVVTNDASRVVLRTMVRQSRAEIGAHLHPWNTPPLSESLSRENLMLNNLQPALQLSKLRVLTDEIADAFGGAPQAFRAGRSALGPNSIDALRQCGYTIDSSVSPFHDLRPVHGPNFVGAPNGAYCIGENNDALRPLDAGPVLEIPLSSGYSRAPFERWDAIHRRLRSRVGRAVMLPQIAARTGLLSRISLKPELESIDDMLRLSVLLIREGTSPLQIMWHSPSLLPGSSPFVQSAGDRDRLLERIRGLIQSLRETAAVKFVTMSEAAQLLAQRLPDLAGPRAQGG